MNSPTQAKYAKLLSEQPKFHAQFGENNTILEKAVNHALARDFLDWLMSNLSPGARTIETGCGYSSVVFSIVQTQHIVISPFAAEHDAIKQWCAANDISTEQTQFIAKPSQNVMPGLNDEPLDLVLIDGDHAFPAPFIDWYYTANRLKQGGCMVVDDIHLVTGTILHEFLSMERGRWELEGTLGKTSIFRKIMLGNVADVEWFGMQPFGARRKRDLFRRVRRKLGKLIVDPEDAIFWD
jgi:predicted O-methyltransferase YrrM